MFRFKILREETLKFKHKNFKQKRNETTNKQFKRR